MPEVHIPLTKTDYDENDTAGMSADAAPALLERTHAAFVEPLKISRQLDTRALYTI